ncbi:MAG: 2-deoxyribose-5-phosphate aldolase [Clostridia bacterium BRH_c25]|nr:MAG: 2-deoxyribose-5-phosphate aldolase [Clostridia bacterium BRH_c25]
MDISKIIKAIDHTCLKQAVTWEDIKISCDEAADLGVASVCIPPSFVKQASEYLDNRMPVCTVIGFPCGYQTKATKVYEAKDAVSNGAQEIDMVINIGNLKDKKYDLIYQEIIEIKEAIGDRVLKVIIETCFLEDEEKKAVCDIITKSGADFIKTSTGFGTYGATIEDVLLVKEHIGKNVKIKAAGGIRTLEDAFAYVEAGVERLGTSAIIKLINKEDVVGY